MWLMGALQIVIILLSMSSIVICVSLKRKIIVMEIVVEVVKVKRNSKTLAIRRILPVVAKRINNFTLN